MKYVERVAVLLCITACSRAEQQASGSLDSANRVEVRRHAEDSVGPPAVADSFTAAPDSPLVLFRLDTDGRGEDFLDPIALISGDKLVRPPVGDINDSAANVFRHTFYGRGQSYRAVGGGEDVGLAGAAAAIDPGC